MIEVWLYTVLPVELAEKAESIRKHGRDRQTER